ncbi:D-isomer specific 2-hydroxyacid dehydrogenase [Caballeronia arationis]|jgi:lactate dehydrogenase-like 2-hydroxyacid dehydrogenase|uniref:Lactate dehydrogenase n=1 Tax=Caballeronia arationis TaxID=1777142 RepID=A0A7Z7I424_9BURK|nr:2-hydroxyacid dehydrogenase [Caballeronia arationis]SAL05286.1 D-isomer specific 2-hydroxyacid dehydrogenase [Caballeronia arationis]SOE53288.1 Lactate dehydrogenase [Caballeronia arationis]
MANTAAEPRNRPIHVLIAGLLHPGLMQRLEGTYATSRLWEQSDSRAFLAEHGARFEVLATSGAIGADKMLIESLPNLELIASVGVGVDPIDLKTARNRGVAVTNTPNVLNGCVADAALGLLLGVARRIAEADRFVRAGDWATEKFPLGTKVGGKLCGIIGMGGIGREIASRVVACGMRVAYHGPTPKSDLPYEYYGSIIDLARAADVLVLSLPGGGKTRHIVDPRVLEALGPHGILINVARGSVVDEDALVSALANGEIAGAGLDVFENEPHVPPSLIALKNVLLTPHIGSGTKETREAMAHLVLDNIGALARGLPLISPV